MSAENIRPKLEEFSKRMKSGNEAEAMEALDEMIAYLYPILEYQGEKADPNDVLAWLTFVLLSALKKTRDDYDAFKSKMQKEHSELRKKMADLEGRLKVIENKEF